MRRTQRRCACRVDDGVLEKAAGVRQLRRIGQLAPAQGDDGVGDLPGRRRIAGRLSGCVDALFRQRLDEAGITDVRSPAPGQAESDFRDGETPVHMPAFLFENAVTVAETAGRAVKLPWFSGIQIIGRQRVETFRKLPPVSADVLHRRGADRAGNQGKILQSRPASRQRPLHEIVPALARARGDVYGLGVFARSRLAGDRHVQDEAVDVAGQHQIAAAAQHEALLAGNPGGGQLRGFGNPLIAHCAGRQRQRVEGRQVDRGACGLHGRLKPALH